MILDNGSRLNDCCQCEMKQAGLAYRDALAVFNSGDCLAGQLFFFPVELEHKTAAVRTCVDIDLYPGAVVSPPAEMRLFECFPHFLCRACLGKMMIICSIKWHRERYSLSPHQGARLM
jgi:hypothetical protein